MKRMLRIALIAAAGLLLAAIIGFVVWASDTNPLMAEAETALQSNSTVTVTSDDWIVFEPNAGSPDLGVIFYPGGRVDPGAYAPLMKVLAEEGYLGVIVPMPLNLAVMGGNRADDVLSAYPDITHWVIGGHSLGGTMAAVYADSHGDVIDGLFFLAAYPTNSSELQNSDMPVISLYGSQDGVAPPEQIESYNALLPAGTEYVLIEGGNHAQFGYYGEQAGDGIATIDHAQQQQEVLLVLTDFLSDISAD